MRSAPSALFALGLPACFTPPALLEVPARPLEEVRAELAPPAEAVELRIDDETRLRGFFVEADPGAPVVLHLQESSGSVADARGGVRHVAAQLADLGFSSLALDYAGVGLSSGDRSCAHLARDARAMWDEAVRRAGGDPARVHLRATSIGTLAAGTLFEGGVRPGSASLILPVLADTVVPRFGRTFHALPGEWAARLLYRPVIDLDLVEVLARCATPLFALSSPDETFVDAEERALLRAAVESAGGTWRELPGGHILLACAARELFVDEARFLSHRVLPPAAERVERLLAALPPDLALRFPPGSAERARLESVSARVHPSRGLVVVALALGDLEPFDAFRLGRHFPRKGARATELAGLAALCDLADPAGPLPIELLDELCSRTNGLQRHALLFFDQESEALARAANARGGRFAYSVTLQIAPGVSVGVRHSNAEVWQALEREQLPFEDTRRRFVRVLLKAYGQPERVRQLGDGRIVLEERTANGWSVVELASEGGEDASFSMHGFVR